MQHHFGEKSHSVLAAMRSGRDQGEADEDLEDLLRDFVTDQATEVATFKGSGQVENSAREAMDYFEKHHPEAHDMMKARTNEPQKLLGKDGAAAALGQTREPFTIRVLHCEFLYVVTAEEFEDTFFDIQKEAVEFARSNYAPWIENAAT